VDSPPPTNPIPIPAPALCGTEGGYGRAGATYVRRRPEDTVLHRVVREHLETFLAETRVRGGGQGLPQFVERELRDFLSCGVLRHGFARFRCSDCAREILVAFSCKGRGFCPSCCGRRMAELAAHLVDGVLGGLPVRQWVLTLPYRLRYALAWDHRLCRAALAVFLRAVLGFERRRARRRGIKDGVGGAVTAIQRVGSALNTNIHFHTLAAQGVFFESADGARHFAPAPAPTDRDVTRLLASVRRRIVRLVARHGIDLDNPSAEVDHSDERQFDFPAYAQIQGAAVVGRVATGPRAGAAPMRLGRAAVPAEPAADDPLHAHLTGFDLHAGVAVPAGDRDRLEHLCRYVLRPPLAQQSLTLTPEGNVILRLRRPWRDGTRAIRFEPSELLERLAAMVPKPRVNLLIYHGAFAPHAHRRAEAVRRALEGSQQRGRCEPSSTAVAASAGAERPSGAIDSRAESMVPTASGPAPTPARAPPGSGYVRPKYFRWADLLERAFAIDVLACPECGGRLRLLATIEDRAVIERILLHLGLPIEVPQPAPARLTGALAAAELGADWIDG